MVKQNVTLFGDDATVAVMDDIIENFFSNPIVSVGSITRKLPYLLVTSMERLAQNTLTFSITVIDPMTAISVLRLGDTPIVRFTHHYPYKSNWHSFWFTMKQFKHSNKWFRSSNSVILTHGSTFYRYEIIHTDTWDVTVMITKKPKNPLSRLKDFFIKPTTGDTPLLVEGAN